MIKIPNKQKTRLFNSSKPSDAIWRHRSGSTLGQVMACCLTAPSHYLNQCWEIPQPSITKIHLKMTYLKCHSNFPGANELRFKPCFNETRQRHMWTSVSQWVILSRDKQLHITDSMGCNYLSFPLVRASDTRGIISKWLCLRMDTKDRGRYYMVHMIWLSKLNHHTSCQTNIYISMNMSWMHRK